MSRIVSAALFFVAAPLLLNAAPSPTPSAAAGGAFQRSSVEGCMNENLFNGVWRVKVLSVDTAAQYNDGMMETGIGVRVQVRNGTGKEFAPDQTGFSDINARGIDLAYDDENTVEAVTSGNGLTSSLMDKQIPPGGAATVVIYFPYGPEKTAKPAKLLIAVDQHSPNNYKHVAYSTKSPSFRIHLDCDAAAK